MPDMKHRIILNTASVAGLLSYGLFNVYFYLFGINPLGPIKFLSFAVVAALFFRALKNHRESELEGFAKFSQLFMAGLVFSFIYASLNAMLIYLHGIAIDGSFVEHIKTETLEQVGQVKDMMISMMGKDKYQAMIAEYEGITAGMLAFGDFQSKAITATLVGLVYALILKKNPPIFDQDGGQE